MIFTTMKLNEKLKKLVAHLESGLIARGEHARMLLLALVAGENAILFGPPGTAKSLLARRLRDCIKGDAKYFECLLTKFSMPEEVFGPVSLKGLEKDEFRRVYNRHMPDATVAFIDETFKANSAILNSMLTILNEREFDTGSERVKVPLRTVVGASNEMPKEAELEALYDRFLIRLRVDRLAEDTQVREFLAMTDTYREAAEDLRLTTTELEEIKKGAEGLLLEEAVINLLIEFRLWSEGQQLKLSDRRLLKIKRLLQFAAFTSGKDKVTLAETWILRHCGWYDFNGDQFEKLSEWVDNRVEKQEADLSELVARVGLEKQALESRAMVHKKNEKGKYIYARQDGSETTMDSEAGVKFKKRNDKYLTKEDAMQHVPYEKYDTYNNGRYTVDGEVCDYAWISKNCLESTTITNTPVLVYGIYSDAQIVRFKEGCASVVRDADAKLNEIGAQIDGVTQSIQLSPWIPEKYQSEYAKGLLSNKAALGLMRAEVLAVIEGYDKLLTSKDPSKLTDPAA